MVDPLIVANCSGFYGDRISAAREMVRGGPIHVLTGDYLAELTLAILYKQRAKNPKLGYATTFLRQMEDMMGECLERGIRVVTNAGGLNPAGLAAHLQKLAESLGLHPKVAWIEGDDLCSHLAELQARGESFCNLDSGAPLGASVSEVLTANAYLGGWGIAKALQLGADIVVCPRVTDASLVVGPAAWRFGWRQDDYDRLAGAVAAGHIIECGPQACGGNFSFFEEVEDWNTIGFPLVEIECDGSFVITKHPGTGGKVTVDTVTAQLLYEIRGPRYVNPDVVARFDTLRLEQAGPNRVRVIGCKGEPPPDKMKVCMNLRGGYRNSMTILLSGPAIETKARIVEEQVWAAVGGRSNFQRSDVQLYRADRPNPECNEQNVAFLDISVADDDADKVGRRFSAQVVGLSLASVPGFTLWTLPGGAEAYVSYWPTLVAREAVIESVVFEGQRFSVPSPVGVPIGPDETSEPSVRRLTEQPDVRWMQRVGTRSGDKGGNANLGVWARNDADYRQLVECLTSDQLKHLLPELSGYSIERYEFPNLRAINFFIRGFLGEGVASSLRFDPQAKTLGEYLRAKLQARATQA